MLPPEAGLALRRRGLTNLRSDHVFRPGSRSLNSVVGSNSRGGSIAGFPGRIRATGSGLCRGIYLEVVVIHIDINAPITLATKAPTKAPTSGDRKA